MGENVAAGGSVGDGYGGGATCWAQNSALVTTPLTYTHTHIHIVTRTPPHTFIHTPTPLPPPGALTVQLLPPPSHARAGGHGPAPAQGNLTLQVKIVDDKVAALARSDLVGR